MLRDEDIENVRSSVTMKQLAGVYGYKINRSGYISCPFHGDDVHPSMKVYDADKGYYCFVCNKGGSIFNFVMEHDNLAFEPAVRQVAEMFGIPISDGKSGLSDADRKRMQERKAAREAAEKEREAAIESLNQLSAKIHRLEEWQGYFEPFSDVWCRLLGMINRLNAEWEQADEALRKKRK